MKLFGPDLTAHEAKRLGGMLVVMVDDRRDGDELCERLLDAPNAELNGKPLRWGIDNRTWYKFLGGVDASEFMPALKRLMDDEVSQEDFQPVAKALQLILQNGRCTATVKECRLEQFDYDRAPGYYAWVWELKPIERSATIICRGCGAIYDFASQAGLVSGSALIDEFLKAGRPVFVHSAKKRPDADMFMQTVLPEHRGVPKEIIEWLRAGNYRRWWCQNCRREQGYPASLFA